MNFNDFKFCDSCHNRPGYVGTCEKCHYTGFLTLNDEPASVVLGEQPKYARKIQKEKKKNEIFSNKAGSGRNGFTGQ